MYMQMKLNAHNLDINQICSVHVLCRINRMVSIKTLNYHRSHGRPDVSIVSNQLKWRKSEKKKEQQQNTQSVNTITTSLNVISSMHFNHCITQRGNTHTKQQQHHRWKSERRLKKKTCDSLRLNERINKTMNRFVM